MSILEKDFIFLLKINHYILKTYINSYMLLKKHNKALKYNYTFDFCCGGSNKEFIYMECYIPTANDLFGKYNYSKYIGNRRELILFIKRLLK